MNETCAKCGKGQFGIYHRKSDLACAIFNGPYLMGYHETNRFTPSSAPVGGAQASQDDDMPDWPDFIGSGGLAPGEHAKLDRKTKARKVAEDVWRDIRNKSGVGYPTPDERITAALINFAKDCGGTK